ncbi:hypothetical protein AGMMS49949_08020 [Alphaproteobacteria bacterium]|nr:hypothetical protein AGMMS49949_08020 [Alphaproteobacteria bacterium]GHT00405.1 hypothetical protein AGMMS50296_8700 [Alphaproteobacteria bacterium]
MTVKFTDKLKSIFSARNSLKESKCNIDKDNVNKSINKEDVSVKLYKRQEGKFFYFEMWTNGPTSIFHTGEVGTVGTDFESKRDDAFIKKEIQKYLDDGYEEINEDDYKILLVEYKIDGLGSELDLEKRHKLEDFLNNDLGWTGLGFVDGGSIGSGTMEVCCFVVDFDIAKKVIENKLQKTEFSDYSRIYEE